MLLRYMNEFMAIMPTQLPDLLPKDTMEDAEVYDDYVQLTFHPKKQLTVAQVTYMFEEHAHLKILYHRVASEGLKGWQCCCAFSNPVYHHMYKFNATADDHGIVHTITVYIFESLVDMRGTLVRELELHHKAGGMKYELKMTELIKFFL